ncbi:MAG: phosphatase PAP2 family protein [Gammaproteobacteria bacterium]|nr:phosphatase PAP2 family protein [Gammaproteobacteria bacterium]
MLALLRRHLVLILLAVPGVLLVAAPQLDLDVAALFYDPFEGFYLRPLAIIRFVYSSVSWISAGVLVGSLGTLLASWTTHRNREPVVRLRRPALYLLLVMLLGPGLLVNSVFKDQWGRARPSQVQEFGGAKQFTRAAIPADQCEKNCSFVSGHASVGFYFLALAFLQSRRRALWLTLGTTLGLGVGFVRIVQGGHFLSDVLFSGIVVYLTAWLLHTLMFRGSRAAPGL